jgi:hypothetical protein
MSECDGLSSCAAAAVADDAVPAATEEPPVAAVSLGEVGADPKTPAPNHRGRPCKKPRIDIDNEIQEANRLADLFRKMQAASKVAARNATRSKQRLIRKANRLSEQDLMLLAVLKRCGLFNPEDEDGDPVASMPDDEAASATVKKTKAQEHISCRFRTLVSSVPGAAEVLDGLDKGALSAAAISSAVSASSSPSSTAFPVQLTGLKRLPPRQPFKVVGQRVSKCKRPEVESGDEAT